MDVWCWWCDLLLVNSLETDQHVVELDRQDQPKVNYNSRLVTLIREVRQLTVLGYKIPVKILQIDQRAKQYYKQAKELQQVILSRLLSNAGPAKCHRTSLFPLWNSWHRFNWHAWTWSCWLAFSLPHSCRMGHLNYICLHRAFPLFSIYVTVGSLRYRDALFLQ